MHRIFRHLGTAALLGAFCLSARALPASAQDQALIAAAQKEGQVVWYTALIANQVVNPLISAFNKKYPGINVLAQRQDSGELVLKVQSEARAGHPIADVVDGGGQMIPPLVEAGLLEHYAPPAAAALPDRLKSKDGYWTALAVLYLTAAYNTELVKDADAPKTYDDLLDPKWKGKIAWTANPFLSGPPAFIGNMLMTRGEGPGKEYLRKLSQNKIVNIAANQRGVLDTVVGGQYPIALMVFNHHVAIDAAKGAPVKWIKMEPLIENLNIVGIVKNSAHPNAAKLLVDFLSSEDGQKVFRDSNYLPADPKVEAKAAELKPEAGHFKVTSISPEMTAELPGWIKIYDELFK
jgi:iron(III) transport system substrate-binding protein